MKITTLEIEWAKNTLKNYEVLAIRTIANTDYSFVAEIECKDKIFFLKKNHLLFNYEAKLLSYLYKNNTNNLNVYDSNEELNCFITQNSGMQITNNVLEHCTKIAEKFIEIQCKVNLLELANIGLRKFSNNEILEICDKYQIDSTKLLKFWHRIEKVIPLSLEHGDFHLGNILLSENQTISFIDLAEGTITNPLFSLLAFENTLKWRGNLEKSIIEKAKDDWLKIYSQKIQIDLSIIEKMYLYSKEIFPLYCIFGLDYLLKICINEQFKEKTHSKIVKYKNLLNCL